MDGEPSASPNGRKPRAGETTSPKKCQHRASGVRFTDAEALVAQTAGVKWVLRKIQKWKVVPVQQPVREEPQLVMAS